jgi:hypothetical protein
MKSLWGGMRNKYIQGVKNIEQREKRLNEKKNWVMEEFSTL